MLGDNEHFRAPILWLVAPFLLGMVAACAGLAGGVEWLLVAAGGSGLAGLVSRSPRIWAVLIVTAAFLGGWAWMGRALTERPRWRDLPVREAVLEVELTRVFPAVADATTRACLGRITHAPVPIDDLIGQRVYFSAPPPEGGLVRSMRVRVAGLLVAITDEAAREGSFESYLLANAVRFRLARVGAPAVTAPPRAAAALWESVGGRFERILRLGLPPGDPATGGYVAMFMGRRSELTEPQKAAFLHSGTMHLFAISGLHICVIALCLHTLLALARLPPLAVLAAGLSLLLVFVEATGGTPSARRAFAMVALVWLGRSLRRPANPLAALACAATGVLVVDPLALLSLSFQFSYAVVATLLLYGVPLQNRLLALWPPRRFVPAAETGPWRRAVDATVREVLRLASISLAATLVSLPLGFGLFGLGTPGAVVSNIVVVPAAGLAVAAGFASLVSGLVGLTPLSILFNHAAAVVIAAIAAAAEIAAGLPGMFFPGRFTAGWIAPALVLGLIGLCVAGYASRWRRPPGALWIPPALVTLAMVLLVTPTDEDRQSSAMKSAYELAMERLKQAEPDAAPSLNDEQRARLAEIDRVYTGRIAEREIFLQQRLAEARAAGDREEHEKIQKQLALERARLEEEREDEKNRVRAAARA